MTIHWQRKLFVKPLVYFLSNYPLLGIFIGCGILFGLFSQLDLWFSGLFYKTTTEVGGGFYLKDHFLMVTIYHGTQYLAVIITLGLGGAFFASWFPDFSKLRSQRRRIGYLLLVLILGPGLIVHSVFKDHWGRARPNQIQYFGGSQQFTTALTPTNQCGKNCSYVSGHAAVGYYLATFCFVMTRYRRQILQIGLTVGSLIGLVRIIQGGHFLSDIVFAFFIVYSVAWFLNKLMIPDRDYH